MSEGGDQSTVPAATATMDVQMALRAVLKSARFADGLTKGFREAAKALDKRECHFAVLAENCEDPMAVMLVEALCKKHQIPMMKVADKKLLGEWCGLCKYGQEGKARKIISCSVAVVKSFGNDEQANQCLTHYFASRT